MVDATYRVKEARKQFYSENGRHPDDKEVAEATGLSMKRLSAVLLTPKAPRSLDQKMGFNMDLKLSVRIIPFLMPWPCACCQDFCSCHCIF
jgi:DNA-directed RNA polymerase sigma subunit (sigma70/sigma32)